MIAAVMTVESEGDPLAWSSADARGLMQILHGPWDPAANINLGASMLAGYYQEFGSWKLALAAYNAGPGAVMSYGGVPPFQETQDYVVLVRYLYREYSHHRLSAGDRSAFSRSLSSFKRLHHVRHLKAGSNHRHPQHGGWGQLGAPGQVAIPDGCDPSTGCRKPPALLPPPPVADPLWPLGGSIDPLGVVSPGP